MLKVECDSCKASYPIDERRVPPTGLKMRCPKCGHSFLVTNPAGGAPAGAPPPAPGAAPPKPPPAAAPSLKRTMVGVGGAGPVVGAPAPPAAPRPPPAPPVPPARAPMPSDFPAALTSLDEENLPVISTGAADLPAPKAQRAPAAAAPPAPRPAAPAAAARAPMPPPTRAPAAPAAPVSAAARPAPPAPPPKAAAPFADSFELDLPVVSGDSSNKHGPLVLDDAADLPALAGESDLPAIARGADLPSAKRAAPKPPPPRAAAPAPGRPPEDFDLPVIAAALPRSKEADLPATKRGGDFADLPVIAADLPTASAALPIVAAHLPVPAASLPSVAASLPVPAASLPVHAPSLPVHAPSLPVHAPSLPLHAPSLPAPSGGGRGFGEIELPGVSDSLPNAPRVDPKLAAQDAHDPFGGFGEIDLPRDPTASLPPPPMQSVPPMRPVSLPPAAVPALPVDSADFGDIELGESPPRTRSSPRPPPPTHAIATGTSEAGGMGFGEVDLGANESSGGGGGDIGVDAAPRPQATEAPLLASLPAGATAPVSLRPLGTAAAEPKRSPAKWIALGGVAVLVLAGAALQLTPFGAYGYLYIGDMVHAGDYVRATTAAIAGAEATLAPDTYDATKSAVDATYAVRARTPRARPLSAYAAFLDFATGARFGADPARAPRAKQALQELLPPSPPAQYLDAAMAAQAADAGDVDRARKELDAAASRYPGDPIQVEIALLRGNLELAAGDPTAAVAAFTRALELSGKGPVGAADVRPHFGLARAYDQLGNAQGAKKEIDLTLAASPGHPGALVLRAHRKSASVDPADAARDLAAVIDGPAKAHASPLELSAAYAAKAWVSLEHGGASEARDAFEQAIKLDPRSVDALNGEGRLLMNEGRYTEALARFDTAMQVDGSSPDTIANDAEAKLALERLADAKQQLVAARERFPKSLSVMLLLAKVEQHLGNNDAAEAVLRSALAFADPQRADALLPYVAMSELLSARGRLGRGPRHARRGPEEAPALREARARVRRRQSSCRATTTARSRTTRRPGEGSSGCRRRTSSSVWRCAGSASSTKRGRSSTRSRPWTRTTRACRSSAASSSKSRATCRRPSSSSRERSPRRPTTPTCSSGWGAHTWRSAGPTTRCRCSARCSRSGRRAPKRITTSGAR